MIYADMHCDSVTACCDRGEDFSSFSGQVNPQKLKEADCALQCFALFTEGKNAAADFERYAAFYCAALRQNPLLSPVLCAEDALRARRNGKIGAVLAVENAGFLGGDLSGFSALRRLGVRMLSLVWNTPNAFAYPNRVCRGGAPDLFARQAKGLTDLGRAAVEELNRKKIIVDISHLSDGGADDVLSLSSAPVVASHSDCASVCPVDRNLTDAQLKKIADKGGVVGLNFCRAFVGGEDLFEGLLSHYLRLVDVAGEDAAAIGSDFDGIPRDRQMDDCLSAGRLLAYFYARGVSARRLEKLAYSNFMRVFGEVVG